MSDKEEIKNKIQEGYINCRVIVEIVGAPKEYVEKAIKGYVEKIKKGKDIEVLKEEFAEIEEQDKFFSTFVELEMLVKDASTLAFFCFDYMPSSIEIIEPQTFNYRAADFASFFNDLQARLHHIDSIVKQLNAENKVLKTNAGLLLRNNVMITLKEKDKSLKDLSKNTGIPTEQLTPFLDKIIQEGHIEKKKNKYSLIQKT